MDSASLKKKIEDYAKVGTAKNKSYIDFDEKEIKKVLKNRKPWEFDAASEDTKKETADVKKQPINIPITTKKNEHTKIELLPVNVIGFDKLISAPGLERGGIILLSGGAGSGKTIFCLESLYRSITTSNDKAIYISTEEDTTRLKKHMLNNFGWDFFELEEKGKIAFLQLDPIQVARQVEAAILKKKQKLEIDFQTLKMPFKPDRLVFDDVTSLGIAFENSESYRKYLIYLFKMFSSYNSLNFVISETEQDPRVYSRTGIEEFMVDGVIVFYNIKINLKRQNALEILKLRSSKHKKQLVPYKITDKGMEIYPNRPVVEEG